MQKYHENSLKRASISAFKEAFMQIFAQKERFGGRGCDFFAVNTFRKRTNFRGACYEKGVRKVEHFLFKGFFTSRNAELSAFVKQSFFCDSRKYKFAVRVGVQYSVNDHRYVRMCAFGHGVAAA